MVLVWALGCGSGHAPSYTPVSATSQGSLYTLELGDLKMVIDASMGARITEFFAEGQQRPHRDERRCEQLRQHLLGEPAIELVAAQEAAVGRRLPPSTISPTPGTIDAATNVIQLTSGTASIGEFPSSMLAITSTIHAHSGQRQVDVTYTLTNTSPDVTISVAPWRGRAGC